MLMASESVRPQKRSVINWDTHLTAQIYYHHPLVSSENRLNNLSVIVDEIFSRRLTTTSFRHFFRPRFPEILPISIVERPCWNVLESSTRSFLEWGRNTNSVQAQYESVDFVRHLSSSVGIPNADVFLEEVANPRSTIFNAIPVMLFSIEDGICDSKYPNLRGRRLA